MGSQDLTKTSFGNLSKSTFGYMKLGHVHFFEELLSSSLGVKVYAAHAVAQAEKRVLEAEMRAPEKPRGWRKLKESGWRKKVKDNWLAQFQHKVMC